MLHFFQLARISQHISTHCFCVTPTFVNLSLYQNHHHAGIHITVLQSYNRLQIFLGTITTQFYHNFHDQHHPDRLRCRFRSRWRKTRATEFHLSSTGSTLVHKHNASIGTQIVTSLPFATSVAIFTTLVSVAMRRKRITDRRCGPRESAMRRRFCVDTASEN